MEAALSSKVSVDSQWIHSVRSQKSSFNFIQLCNLQYVVASWHWNYFCKYIGKKSSGWCDTLMDFWMQCRVIWTELEWDCDFTFRLLVSWDLPSFPCCFSYLPLSYCAWVSCIMHCHTMCRLLINNSNLTTCFDHVGTINLFWWNCCFCLYCLYWRVC